MVHKVVCNQPPRKSCKIGKHKSLLAAHRDNEKKFLRQRTKSGRATKLHFQKAGYEWKDSSNRWVKTKQRKFETAAAYKARAGPHKTRAAAYGGLAGSQMNEKKEIKANAKKKVNCDKSTSDGRLNNRNGKC